MPLDISGFDGFATTKTITAKDYQKCLAAAQKEADKVPRAHNRVKRNVYHEALIRAVGRVKPRKPAEAPAYIVALSTENAGTRKWPDYYTNCGLYTVGRMSKTGQSLFAFGHRFENHNVIAFVKE